jgi:hypothetical protein
MSLPAPKRSANRRRSSGWRPFSLLLLIFGLLGLSIYGWLRLQQSLALWDILVQIGVWPGPLYLAISGAVWGILGLVAGIGLFLRKNWATRFTQIAILFMAAWYWFDRLVLVRSEAAQTNLVFMGLLTFLAIAFTFAVLRKIERVQKVKEQNAPGEAQSVNVQANRRP